MASNPEALSCISIIICDDVIRDNETKKSYIIGAFNAIITSRVPFRVPAMAILATFTNGRGEYDLSISVEHAQTGTPIAEFRGPFVVKDPLTIHDLSVKLKNFPIPAPGKYWVEVKADGALVTQRPFTVVLKKPETDDESQSQER